MLSKPIAEQIALLDAASDDALLLTGTERRKRYTAAQVRKLEEKLDCICAMLASGNIPLTRIAEAAHVNHRTVQTLAGCYAERIGADALKFSEYAAGKSAKFLYLADSKAADANYKDLMIGHGIARDTAINLRAAGMGQENMDAAIDIEQENPALLRARKFLEARLSTALETTVKGAND